MTNFIPWHSEYCIRLTSGRDETLCLGKNDWLYSWHGHPLELLQNGKVIHSFPKGFTDEKKCLAVDQVDKINDVFHLRCVGTDGVSIALFRLRASES